MSVHISSVNDYDMNSVGVVDLAMHEQVEQVLLHMFAFTICRSSHNRMNHTSIPYAGSSYNGIKQFPIETSITEIKFIS